MPSHDPPGTIGKVSVVLEALARAKWPTTLKDLASVVPYPKPTIHRLLVQLQEAGMVSQDPTTRGYRLGRRLISLAAAVLDDIDVRRVGRDVLYDLMRGVNESVYLTVLDGSDIVYIDVVECDRSVRVLTRVGMRRPAATTATGKTLLAFAPADVRRNVLAQLLTKDGAATGIDPIALERELAFVRDRGVAVSRDTAEAGVTGIAAPVRTSDGQCVAAVGVAVPSYRFDAAAERETRVAVTAAAHRLDALLDEGAAEVGSLVRERKEEHR